MRITDATQDMRQQIVSLLQGDHLPVDDLPEVLDNFFVAIDQDAPVGVIGMETYGQYGLLRSMVVHPEYRRNNIASTLVSRLEKKAAKSGIAELYLLTETASGYFQKKGFEVIDRKSVPQPITKSSEFSHVCPVSAIVMKKDLIN
ncbi:arsenic resistance N-acetyltransferase ArsN2 [Paraflavitalea pollutisoli]|uniref:arsenic resistance N-acetyltransferase ArsN2 n=1 Tax=Paraflavitalea pollutisoli TaxID=3034143 RepID=UPI0023EE06BD|nr:arsenic resistance N-acetyltransferase ArsN2 [Paraflavitalea sp. H1-2-19X]